MSDFACFKNQVVLITGGNRDIGRGIAEAFLGADARVIVCGRSRPEALPACGDNGVEFANSAA